MTSTETPTTETTTEGGSTTEASTTSTGAAPGTSETTGQSTTGDEGGSGEAARRRRQLRETEAERDTLRGQLDAMRRAEVARLATSGDGARLHAAVDVFGAERDLADLLDDEGRVDPAAVTAAVERETADRPHLRADIPTRPRLRPDPSQGSSSRHAAAGGEEDRGEAWRSLLRGARK